MNAGEPLPGDFGRDPDRPAGASAAPTVTDPYFIFRIGPNWYAFPAQTVTAVATYSSPVRVPGVPAFVRGVIKFGGGLLVLVDAADLLGVPQKHRGGGTQGRCLVIQARGLPLALVADEVGGIVRVEPTRLRPVAGDALVDSTFNWEGGVAAVLGAERLIASAESRVGGG